MNMTAFDWHPYKIPSYIAESHLIRLVKGIRVLVHSVNPDLDEREGTVIDSTSTDNWDCIVKIDGMDKPMSFYWQEIMIL